ncbi:MAG: hypothetical protein Ta2E_02100 [Mycoplasmoidaceae bacterium]|nr:MAG: hypothetical protein Ta2E_02100 [Mycoplasmoidaceae bacterium]
MKPKRLLSLFVFPIFASTPLLALTACSKSDKVVFANYESYFSNDLTRKYQDKISFLYFSNDGDIRNKFRNSYDIAIPSSSESLRYMSDNWLAKIDWTAFGKIAKENYPDQATGSDYFLQYVDENGDLQDITCGKDAENLLAGNEFTDFNTDPDVYPSIEVQSDVYHIVQEINEDCWINKKFPKYYMDDLTNIYGSDAINYCSIMDYIIPYFIQDFSFAYKGDRIDSLVYDEDTDEGGGWTDILAATGKGNKHDSRFDGRHDNKILMNDDLRTNFDLSKIIEWESGEQYTPLDINPTEDSIAAFEKTYEGFFNAYKGTNEILLNSDGGMLCSNFADPRNSSNGLLGYNGDSLLSSIGNDEEISESYWANKWFEFSKTFNAADIEDDYDDEKAPMHIVAPSDNIFFMDTVVTNKKSVKLNTDGSINLSDRKTHDMYNFIYLSMLDHLDYSFETDVASDDGSATGEPSSLSSPSDLWYDDENQIWAWDDDKGTEGNYVYDPMVNFDYTLYPSPWAKIDQYIWGYQYDKVSTGGGNYDYMPIDCGADYFWETVEGLFTTYTDVNNLPNVSSSLKDTYGEDAWIYADDNDNYCYPMVSMLLDAYHISVGNTYDGPSATAIDCMEKPLNDLAKTNMHWGYSHVKSKL